MATYEHEIDIDVPIDYAFAWGNDPENWQRMTPALLDVEVLEETDEGIRYRSTMKMLGRTSTVDDLTTIDEENYETVSTIEDGDMDGEFRWTFTETESGTNVRVTGHMVAESLFDRALQPIFVRYMRRQFRNSFQTMKDLVEAEYAAERQEAPAV